MAHALRCRVLSAKSGFAALAPFRVRSFRFQWPADLSSSWAFEMETLILGWYVLVETGSVLLLTLFASLLYVGTLIAPMFGVVAHRIGNKKLFCAMRAFYATQATILMTLALTGVLIPLHVFIIATLMGIVRPSDLVMRYALIGATMPAERLVGASSVSRTTQDSARIIGALAGAGLVAALGMGLAYLVIASFYSISFLLTLGVAGARAASRPPDDMAGASSRPSPWRDLRDGIAYVWNTPQLLAAMYLAFLANLAAFPLVMGLLPYVAKEIFGTDRTGLSYMVASLAFGALLSSLALSGIGRAIRPARTMVVFCAMLYAMIAVFAQMQSLVSGMVFLALTGAAQSLSMISMSAMLLRNSGEQFRSRVMGIRTLVIYGVPIGLLLSGPLIARFGYPATATVYCAIGLALTLLIGVRWRAHLWRLDAPANVR